MDYKNKIYFFVLLLSANAYACEYDAPRYNVSISPGCINPLVSLTELRVPQADSISKYTIRIPLHTTLCAFQNIPLSEILNRQSPEPLLITGILTKDTPGNYVLHFYETSALLNFKKHQGASFFDPLTRLKPLEYYHFHISKVENSAIRPIFLGAYRFLELKALHPLLLLHLSTQSAKRYLQLAVMYDYGFINPDSNALITDHPLAQHYYSLAQQSHLDTDISVQATIAAGLSKKHRTNDPDEKDFFDDYVREHREPTETLILSFLQHENTGRSALELVSVLSSTHPNELAVLTRKLTEDGSDNTLDL